jgi:phosphopantothenoylcysteine decarboxylase/phosphopantothenate--cysteine ligase
MDHIEWARFAQVLLVAPASADAIGRLAHGLADDFLSTIALALDPQKPRLLAPAMNPVMLAAPAVQRNLATLTADGWTIIAPGAGRMACGESGLGRLAEVDELVAALSAVLPRA